MENAPMNIGEDVEVEDVEEDQYLVFVTKGQEFAIQGMRVTEISAPMPMTKVPGTRPYIEGIINLRGRLVSVIDFRKKFGFEPKGSDEDTRIMMVEYGGYPIGVIVDQVEEVIKIPGEKVQGLPEGIAAPASEKFIKGVGMLENRLIILLDADKLLTATELKDLEATKQAIEGVMNMKNPGGSGGV